MLKISAVRHLVIPIIGIKTGKTILIQVLSYYISDIIYYTQNTVHQLKPLKTELFP